MWTVDWGGTRTKIAWWEKDQMQHHQVIPSPETLWEALDMLRAGPLALALPGRVPLPFENDSLWKYGPLPRKEESGKNLQDECQRRGLDLRLVLQDTAAAGFGAAWGETAYVAQLSTGIAMRVFIGGKMLLLGGNPALQDLAFQAEYEGRSFYDWLRRERRWVQRDWLEIGDAGQQAADIFTAFVEEGMRRGPDAGVYLVGGGAEVLREELSHRLGDRLLGIAPSETVSLQGLHNLRGGSVPTLESTF